MPRCSDISVSIAGRKRSRGLIWWPSARGGGGTVFNVRREDVAPEPMGIAITLAGRAARDRTAPHISHTRKSWQRYFAL